MPANGESPPSCLWCEASLAGAAPAGRRRLRCSHCGSDTTWPAPGKVELDEAYESWYRPEGGRFSGPGDLILRRTRGRLAARLDAIGPPGPVLDVGSGDGALLAALRRRGRQAVGTERPAGEPSGNEEGIPAGGEPRPWSAIVFWHSLEHLPEPGRTVADLAEGLGDRGVMVISMPNSQSLQARLFGDRWLHLDLPRHLVHVPAPTLLRTLRASDLEIERISHLRGGQVTFGWLHGLVGMLPGRPDLYDAIRRTEARSAELPMRRRITALVAAVFLLPVAAALALIEAGLRRGGTVYVEARRV